MTFHDSGDIKIVAGFPSSHHRMCLHCGKRMGEHYGVGGRICPDFMELVHCEDVKT